MKLHSLAISGLLTMDMHSLNNEGSEGNHLLTRQVQIVDKDGRLHAVNAVSGDMFKHIQAEHLFQLARDEQLPLCNGCQSFGANRISADKEFADQFAKGVQDEEILGKAIQRCLLDDAEGILITREIGEKGRAIGRKSVLEFGWLIGRPEQTKTEAYFHIKFDTKSRADGSGEGANLGQNIFHRPASSGQYAVVLNVDLYRLGLNDIALQYAISPEERKQRLQALLKSVLFTFLKPSGAQRNTQNPHLLNFEGVIACSSATYPAPQASALNPEYNDEIAGIAAALNQLKAGTIDLKQFDSLSSFAQQMQEIITEIEPFGV